MKRIVFIISFLLLLTAGHYDAPLLYGGALISSINNIPNPFSAGSETTMIRYFLEQDAEVNIVIYNLIGDKVILFGPGDCPGEAGINQKEWDGRNSLGRSVANGCYLCFITASSSSGGASLSDRSFHKIAVLK